MAVYFTDSDTFYVVITNTFPNTCFLSLVRRLVLIDRNSWRQRTKTLRLQHGHGQLQRSRYNSQQRLGRRGEVCVWLWRWRCSLVHMPSIIFLSLSPVWAVVLVMVTCTGSPRDPLRREKRSAFLHIHPVNQPAHWKTALLRCVLYVFHLVCIHLCHISEMCAWT